MPWLKCSLTRCLLVSSADNLCKQLHATEDYLYELISEVNRGVFEAIFGLAQIVSIENDKLYFNKRGCKLLKVYQANISCLSSSLH